MHKLFLAAAIFFIAIGVGVAGSVSGTTIGGWPLLLVLVLSAFVIQWLMFIHSWAISSEKYFDLTGSLTYIGLTTVAILFTEVRSLRSFILCAMVVIWALRLGSYLFLRIRKAGKDDRFTEILSDPARLFLVWSVQGLWITFTALAAWIGITTTNSASFAVIGIVGVIVWILGFAIEALADYQKAQFRKDPANSGRFIHSGLWSRSRHPNYFGEILIWSAVLITVSPVLHSWQWIAILSPAFVAFLLIKVSGIPMLEKKAEIRWGDDPEYQNYKNNTPVLIPKITAR
ncbi:DUF1295 domain-containing protein [Arcanobacterium pinnipediorum]|uniref:DUF1295 domain-containing protein n=1 Tax=Arcanobacterium pinnipediorum TaxID=1503041 RepID=A0ABY5AES7_9ACTO|nr:DUF1295 domain-containing protein [Arcanobacterium pinnipediorum]USR78714.1 DUF1295 domain-containing protein [Arcanobacterium pinnipediorum]